MLRILFLQSTPHDLARLRVNAELRAISLAILHSKNRDNISVYYGHALRARDPHLYLRDFKPDIVHFSGHGEFKGVYVEDEHGAAHCLEAAALETIFRSQKDKPKCVFLNACESSSQTEKLSTIVDCAIGMNGKVSDPEAIVFAEAFYGNICEGENVQKSFELARAAMTGPQLSTNPRLNAAEITFDVARETFHLCAQFKLSKGKPSYRAVYSITLYVRNPPSGTMFVNYTLMHSDLKDQSAGIQVTNNKFEHQIKTFGDTNIEVYTEGGGQGVWLRCKLSDALRIEYMQNQDPYIQKAIADIASH